MTARTKKDKALATFEYPMQIEVRKAKFRPLASGVLIDRSRLGKGSHRVEVGFAEVGCCDRLVTAVIKNGMVTNIEIEACEDSKKSVQKKNSKKPDHKKLNALVEAARKAIGVPKLSEWKPVPVADFFASPSEMSRIIVSTSGWCILICGDIFGRIFCLSCCLLFPFPLPIPLPTCDLDPIFEGPLN